MLYFIARYLALRKTQILSNHAVVTIILLLWQPHCNDELKIHSRQIVTHQHLVHHQGAQNHEIDSFHEIRPLHFKNAAFPRRSVRRASCRVAKWGAEQSIRRVRRTASSTPNLDCPSGKGPVSRPPLFPPPTNTNAEMTSGVVKDDFK